MKVRITEHGCLVLTPESETERYALRQWTQAAKVPVADLTRMEDTYFRGSHLMCEYLPK